MTEKTHCSICGVLRSEHTELEKSGDRKHRFSENDELRMVNPPSQPKPRTNSVDLALRTILLARGLITRDDLVYMDAQNFTQGPKVGNESG